LTSSSASLRTFQTLVRPSIAIPWHASQVHGITNAMVRGAPAEADVVRALRDFIGAHTLVAHNASFDVKVLRGAFQRADVAAPGSVAWCTLKLSRRFVSEAPSHRLGDLAKHLSLETLPSHRAMADVLTTRALLEVILDRATARQLKVCRSKSIGMSTRGVLSDARVRGPLTPLPRALTPRNLGARAMSFAT
jgi:DNA polymerase III epsilon subunit-like protein